MTNSRDKGNRFERRIANTLKEAFGVNLRRTPLSGGWAEDHPDTAGDIVNTDPEADWPYSIECKNSESWRLESLFTDNHKWFDDWWKQTLDECPEGKIPVLIFTRNYCPTFVATNNKVAMWVGGIDRIYIEEHDVVIYEFDTWIEMELTLRKDGDDV